MAKELYMCENIQELNLLVDRVPDKIKDYSVHLTCKSLNNIYNKAEVCDKRDNDEEAAYVYYMRFYNLLMKIRKLAQYKKDAKYFDSLVGIKNAKFAIQRAAELQDNLLERYKKTNKTESQDSNDDLKVDVCDDNKGPDQKTSFDSNDLDNFISGLTSKSPTVSQANKPQKRDQNSASKYSDLKFIEVNEFQDLVRATQPKALVLDIRSTDHFDKSRMLYDHCINIPELIIKPGLTTSGHIAKFLLNEQDKKLWSRRSEYDNVVLIDWNTSTTTQAANQKLIALVDIIHKFDSYVSLRREPQVLNGGYERWMLQYPSYCTNFNPIQVYVEEDFSERNTCSFEFDYPALPVDGDIDEPVETVATNEEPTSSTTQECSAIEDTRPPHESNVNFASTVDSKTELSSVSSTNDITAMQHSEVPERPAKPEKFSTTRVDNTVANKPDVGKTIDNNESLQRQEQLMKDLQHHHVQQEHELLDRHRMELVAMQEQLEKAVQQRNLLLDEIKERDNLIAQQNDTIKQQSLKQKQLEEEWQQKQKSLSRSESSKSKLSDESNVQGVTSVTANAASDKAMKQDQQAQSKSSTSEAKIDKKDTEQQPEKEERKKPTAPAVDENKIKQTDAMAKKAQLEAERKILQEEAAKRKKEEEENRKKELEVSRLKEEESKSLEDKKKQLIKKQKEELQLQKQKQIEDEARLSRQLDQERKIKQTLKQQQILTTEQQESILNEERTAIKERTETNSQLPEGWYKELDKKTGRFYYVNPATKSTQWDPPVQPKSIGSERSEKNSNASTNVSQPPTVNRTLKSTSTAISKPPSVNRSNKPTECLITQAKLRRLAPVLGAEANALTGLRNLGNTCYMNSVLQCLINTIPLATYFLSNTYKEDINRNNPLGMRGEIAEEFAVVVNVTWCGEYRYISPTDFKLTVSKFANQFAGSSQHDSQELLLFLLDGLHEDTNKALRKQYIQDEDNSHLPDQEASKIAWDRHKQRNQSIVVELFQGQFKSTLVCLTCQKKSVTFEAFMYLSLPLPSRKSHCTLNDCLNLLSRAERVHGNDKWYCSKCKCHREAMKKLEIWKLPPILLIHFKRFSVDGLYWQKLDTAVNFPINGLSLENQMVGPGKRRYNLYAISNHYGTLEGGHYTAACQNAYTKQWYKFDDHILSRTTTNEVKTSAAYILFYTSLNIPPPKLKKFS